MILFGDAFHNYTDGIFIAASILAAITIGLAAALSVIAHEILQEVGDFGILIHCGYSKRKALIFNTFSDLTTLPAAVIFFLCSGYYSCCLFLCHSDVSSKFSLCLVS